MARLESISAPVERDLLVSFTSLAGFNKRFVLQSEDRAVFDAMRDYYAWAGALIQKRGGTVIKCIGDGMLVVFAAEDASEAVMALKELKSEGDAWLQKKGLPCQHLIKAHLGPAILGPIGAPGQERLDGYGKTVDVFATLDSGNLVMTPQVVSALESDT